VRESVRACRRTRPNGATRGIQSDRNPCACIRITEIQSWTPISVRPVSADSFWMSCCAPTEENRQASIGSNREKPRPDKRANKSCDACMCPAGGTLTTVGKRWLTSDNIHCLSFACWICMYMRLCVVSLNGRIFELKVLAYPVPLHFRSRRCMAPVRRRGLARRVGECLFSIWLVPCTLRGI